MKRLGVGPRENNRGIAAAAAAISHNTIAIATATSIATITVVVAATIAAGLLRSPLELQSRCGSFLFDAHPHCLFVLFQFVFAGSLGKEVCNLLARVRLPREHVP